MFHNNRGQVLVLFIIFLPLLLLFLGYVFDIMNINYEKNKLDNISYLVEDEIKNKSDQICDIVLKNDKNINCIESDEKIILKKKVKSLFGKIVNKNYYEIEKEIRK